MSHIDLPTVNHVLLITQNTYPWWHALNLTTTPLIVANDKQQALTHIRQTQFALVLLEAPLDNLTDLAHQIRNQNGNLELPMVFILPAETLAEEFLTGHPHGTVDYLHHPISVLALQYKIKLWSQLSLYQQQVQRQGFILRQQLAQHTRLEEQLERYKNHFELQVEARSQELERKIFEQTTMFQALNEAENRYQEIFENTIEGIFQTTPEGQYLRVNPALVRIYGYTSPEEMMMVLNDIEHQLYVSSRRRAEFAQILELQDVVTDFESEIYRKDGTIIWIKENARAVRNQHGELLYYEGTVEDITARKHAEEELRRINRASDRFVPYQLLHLLGKKNITELQLNDCVQRRMSIVFVDIRSFTSLSEQMSPLENFQFLNTFLSQMGPIIQQHHGFIDKYLGDGLLALFLQASEAVEASIAMLRQLRAYNERRQKLNEPNLSIGIGINTGEVMLGTVGYHKRLEGTVIGDTVNLAARIEQLTKYYESPLLIGQETFNELELPLQNLIRLVDRVRVKGKTRQATIYEVFAADSPPIRQAKLETKSTFEKAWLLYQQHHLAEAQELFTACLQHNPHDAMAQKYLEACLNSTPALSTL